MPAGERRARAQLAEHIQAHPPAAVEIRGGAPGRLEVSQGEQLRLLRQEVAALRDRLQREAQAYGELRAQSARHEVIAKDALSRAADLETRLQRAQQELGAAHAQIAELTARTHEPKPPKSAKRTAPKASRNTRRSKPRQSVAARGVKRSKSGRVRLRKSRRR